MPTIDTTATVIPAVQPQIRKIGMSDIDWALAEGWRDFRAMRGDLIFAGLLYPLICLVAAVFTLNEPLLPLFFPLVAGLSIAGPAVASGFYELARRREEGADAGWGHFLDPLKGRSRAPLVMLTLGLAALFVAWLIVAYTIYALTFGANEPMRMADFFGRLFSTREGWELIVFGNLAGFAFAVATLIISVVSFPMVVDRPVDAGAAVHTSLRAVQANPVVMFAWGLRVVALLVLGLVPFAIGLAVVLPWLGYATWHLYTRTVVR